MSKVRSNADAIVDDLADLVDTFDFTLPGKGSSLGEDLADAACESIRYRCLAGEMPDGSDFKKNDPKWAAYKAARYNAYQPGIMGGQMFSQESMNGQRIISADSIEIVYGTGDPPRKLAANGVELRKHELIATDREKATYFTDGGRVFFAFNAQDGEAVLAEASDAWDQHVIRKRGGP